MFAAPPGMTLWLRLLTRQMSMCEDGTSYSGEKKKKKRSPWREEGKQGTLQESNTDSADSLPVSVIQSLYSLYAVMN